MLLDIPFTLIYSGVAVVVYIHIQGNDNNGYWPQPPTE